jgi:hypothetical protein
MFQFCSQKYHAPGGNTLPAGISMRRSRGNGIMALPKSEKTLTIINLYGIY